MIFLKALWALASAFSVYSLSDQNFKSPIDQALIDHCEGINCGHPPSYIDSITVQTNLDGAGFHRTLHYSIKLSCVDIDAAAAPSPCDLAVLQPLPAAIYANIYELGAAAASHKGPKVRLFGPVDVESIEKYSSDTAVAVYALQQANCGVPTNISLPLHARYIRARVPGGFEGLKKAQWRQLLVQEMVPIDLPPGRVLMKCGTAEENTAWKEVEKVLLENNNSIVWVLPAGNLALAQLTAAVTSLVVCGAALAVLHALIPSSKAGRWVSKSSVSKRKSM